MRLLYALLAVAGCARAGVEAGGFETPDGGMAVRPDGGSTMTAPDAAPLPDAPVGQQTVTLSQTNDTTVAVTEFGCQQQGTFVTRANRYFRVFRLADHGVTGAFNVQRVTFYIDWTLSGTGATQPATINVGTYSGTVGGTALDLAQITPLTSKDIQVPNGDATQGQPPPVVTDITATAPAGSNVIVELAVPDGLADGNIFLVGYSAGGQTAPGYIAATECGNSQPLAITTLGETNALLLSVTGTH